MAKSMCSHLCLWVQRTRMFVLLHQTLQSTKVQRRWHGPRRCPVAPDIGQSEVSDISEGSLLQPGPVLSPQTVCQKHPGRSSCGEGVLVCSPPPESLAVIRPEPVRPTPKVLRQRVQWAWLWAR